MALPFKNSLFSFCICLLGVYFKDMLWLLNNFLPIFLQSLSIHSQFLVY